MLEPRQTSCKKTSAKAWSLNLNQRKKNLFIKDNPANTLASLQTQLKIHTLKASARLQTI